MHGSIMKIRARLLSIMAVPAVILLSPSVTCAQRPSSSANAPPAPGDLIRLTIWREPDLSGDFRVDESDRVTLPKVGDVSLGGVSPDSLKAMLRTKYSQVLRDPSIEVTVLRRVQVIGAVNKPGLYDADALMSVGDVLAMAGGPTSDGKSDEVRLRLRGSTNTLHLSAQDIRSTGISSGEELYVPQRSWIARNGAIVTGAVISAAGIITAEIIARH